MITKDERKKDRAVCEAATPGPWEVDTEESIVWQRGPCAGEGAAIGSTEEMPDAIFMARARDRLPVYIADAEEMERRIADAEAVYKEALATQDEESALPEGMLLILRILRGEPAADVLRLLRGEP